MPGSPRILLLDHCAESGGAENSMLAFLRAADRERFRYAVACPAPGNLADALSELGITVLPMDFARPRRKLSCEAVGHGMHVLVSSRRLGQLLRTVRPHLVDANTTVAALHAWLALGGRPLPLVWHVRDLKPTGIVGNLLYQRTDAVVAISRAVAQSVRSPGRDDNKIHLIPNGIDADRLKPTTDATELRRRLNLPPNAPLVSVVAQLTPWKGHDCLLSAWSLLHRRIPQAVLLIVGSALWPEDRTWEAHLKQLADRLRLMGSVRFLGRRSDVASIIPASVTLVMPSTAEPFGRVALEAMALGKPVVGTNAGGLPEVVLHGETGLLVKPQEPDALAKAIEQVLTDEDLADRLGRAGASRVRECFDIADTVQLTQDLYESLLTKNGGR